MNPVLHNLANCTGRMTNTCRLCTKGLQVPGSGNYVNPKFIVISDYPGKQEELANKTLVGLSGGFLRRQLLREWHPEVMGGLRQHYTGEMMRLPAGYRFPEGEQQTNHNKARDREIFKLNEKFVLDMVRATDSFAYFTNLVKCLPKDTKLVGVNEMTECKGWITKELAAISIDVPVYVTGRIAFEWAKRELMEYYGPLEDFLGVKKKDLNMLRLREQVWQDKKGRKYIFGLNTFQYESLAHKHYYEPEEGKVMLDYLNPPPLLSGLWLLQRDISLLRKVVDGQVEAHGRSSS
jgi:uracil-DNA glycosylase